MMLNVTDRAFLAVKDSLSPERQQELVRLSDLPQLEAWLDAKKKAREEEERRRGVEARREKYGTDVPIGYDCAED